MWTRLSLLGSVALAGCIHGGTVAAKEPPPLAYQAPDIDEITGIETPDADDADSAPAPAPAPTSPSGAKK